MGETAASCWQRSLLYPLAAITMMVQHMLHISDLRCLEEKLCFKCFKVLQMSARTKYLMSPVYCPVPLTQRFSVFPHLNLTEVTLKDVICRQVCQLGSS